MIPSTNGHRSVLDQYGQPYRRQDDWNAPYDSFAIPQVLTFSSILGSAQRAYYHERWDEALKHSRDDALVMRRDCFLMGLLQERKLATASLKWHLEVDDETDLLQKAVKDQMTAILKATPRLPRLIMSLLEAIWYGRYGVQMQWHWKDVLGRRSLCVKKHIPINGDKIGHKYDGTPYILVHPSEGSRLPKSETTLTTAGGWGIVLRGSWRERFLIHEHEIDDADYFDSEGAEGVHGIGVRSRVFWLDWLKREYLSWLVDFLERVGLGVTIYYYDASNPQSKQKAEEAAKEQNRRSVILWPRVPGQTGNRSDIERIETPTRGAQVLLQMQQHIETVIERYIIGQEGSSSASSASGHSNHESAAFMEDTKHRITRFDAANLAETLTGDELNPGLVSITKRWTFPAVDFPVRWVFDVDDPKSSDKLEAVSKAVGIGVDFVKNEVRALTGLSDPKPGDDVIGGGMGGMPGQEDQGMMGGEGAPPDEEAGGQPGGGPPNGKPGGGQKPSGESSGGKGKPDLWRPFSGPKGGKWKRHQITGHIRHAGLMGFERQGELLRYEHDNQDYDAGGHWITIGAKDGHGGSPVFIKDGKIAKGHPSLKGKPIVALEAHKPKQRDKDEAGNDLYESPEEYDRISKLEAQEKKVRKQMRDAWAAGHGERAGNLLAQAADLYYQIHGEERHQHEIESREEMGFKVDYSDTITPAKWEGDQLVAKPWAKPDPARREGRAPEPVNRESAGTMDAPAAKRKNTIEGKKAAREHVRAVWGREAEEAGINPDALHHQAATVLAHDAAHKKDVTEMLQEARRISKGLLTSTGGKHSDLTGMAMQAASGSLDHSQLRGFDSIVKSLAYKYPAILGETVTNDPEQKLFDYLVKGNPDPMAEDEAYKVALDFLHRTRTDHDNEREVSKEEAVKQGIDEFDIENQINEATGQGDANDNQGAGDGDVSGGSADASGDADHHEAVHQAFQGIQTGGEGYVDGWPVRRIGDSTYRIETDKGFVEGSQEEVTARIQREWEDQKPDRKRIEAAVARAEAHTEPNWTDAAGMEAAAKGFEALPKGARVISLDEKTKGRIGQIVKDEEGKNRVKLDGSPIMASSNVEPLDENQSWRSKKNKDKKPGEKQGGMFEPREPGEEDEPAEAPKPKRTTMPKDNYRKSLAEHAKELHHSTSVEEALGMIPGSQWETGVDSSGFMRNKLLSDEPSKGDVQMRFGTEGLQGQIQGDKWQDDYAQGKSQFVATKNSQDAYHKSLRSISISKDKMNAMQAKPKKGQSTAYQKRMLKELERLESEGWIRSDTSQGTTWTHPEHTRSPGEEDEEGYGDPGGPSDESIPFAKRGTPKRYAGQYDESKHKRGTNPQAKVKNPGQYTSGGGGAQGGGQGGQGESAPPPSHIETGGIPEGHKDALLDRAQGGVVGHRQTTGQSVITSASFKAWFGDWEADPANSSKVVNDKGEPQETFKIPPTSQTTEGKPIVLFHGTNAAFDEFSHKHSGKTDHGHLGKGFYFTNKKDVAESYASRHGGSQNVMAVYLNIRNPYVTKHKYAPPKSILPREQWRPGFPNEGFIENKAGAEAFTNHLKSLGHDGVCWIYGETQEWIAFEPNQIKSVTNQGTFDPSSGKIDQAKHGQPKRYVFDESKVKRGQPDNAGKFGPGGFGKKDEGGGGQQGQAPAQSHVEGGGITPEQKEGLLDAAQGVAANPRQAWEARDTKRATSRGHLEAIPQGVVEDIKTASEAAADPEDVDAQQEYLQAYSNHWRGVIDSLGNAGANEKELGKIGKTLERAHAVVGKKWDAYNQQHQKAIAARDVLEANPEPEEPAHDVENYDEAYAQWESDFAVWDKQYPKLEAAAEKESERLNDLHEALHESIGEHLDEKVEEVVSEVTDAVNERLDAEEESDQEPEDEEEDGGDSLAMQLLEQDAPRAADAAKLREKRMEKQKQLAEERRGKPPEFENNLQLPGAPQNATEGGRKWSKLLEGIDAGEVTSGNYQAKASELLATVPKEKVREFLNDIGIAERPTSGAHALRMLTTVLGDQVAGSSKAKSAGGQRSLFQRQGQPARYNAPYEESKHKRGTNPGSRVQNPGQFASGGGGGGGAKGGPAGGGGQAAPPSHIETGSVSEQQKESLLDMAQGKVSSGEPVTAEQAESVLSQRASAKAEYQQLGTRSKAFKSWFGDWEADPENSSKVVNAEGEPQETHRLPTIMYHGTQTGGFGAFDKSKKNATGQFGPGFYFTENEEVAKGYSTTTQNPEQPRHGESEVKAAYLNIRNPFDGDKGIDKIAKNLSDHVQGMTDEQISQITGKDMKEAKFTRSNWAWRLEQVAEGKISHRYPDVAAVLGGNSGQSQLNNLLASAGYDGITHTGGRGSFKNVIEKGALHKVWIAFEPNQIKSVQNQGTFDPNDDRLDYAGTGPVLRYAAPWEERKHPRVGKGSEHGGEFGKGGGGGQAAGRGTVKAPPSHVKPGVNEPPPDAALDAAQGTPVENTPPLNPFAIQQDRKPEPFKEYPETDQKREKLRTADVVKMKRSESASLNEVWFINLEGGGKGVWKPARGETYEVEGMQVRENVKGRFFAREAAASDVASILGMDDLVPPTVIRNIGKEMGSCQQFVPDALPAKLYPDDDDRYDGPEDLARAAAFDYLVGNSDRHAGNWMLDKDGKLALIDNGLAFPDKKFEDRENALMFLKAKGKLPAQVKSWEWEPIQEALKNRGMNEKETGFTKERFDDLQKSKTFFDLHRIRLSYNDEQGEDVEDAFSAFGGLSVNEPDAATENP